jgi:HlyD family secretion protein
MNDDKQDTNREWYIAREGKEFGPVGIEVLRSGVDTGTIVPSDFVWSPGLPKWIPILEVVSPNPTDAKSSGVSNADGIRKQRATANQMPTTLNHLWKAGRAASNDAWRRIKPFKVVETAGNRCLSQVRRALAFLQSRGEGKVLRNEDREAAFRRIETEQDPRRAIRKLSLMGFAVAALLLCGVGGWAATSQLAGAVIAPGTIVVESNIKKVQHPTGGVVGEIFVKEGGAVEEGQVVLRLDDTVTRSTLGVVRSQLDELMAREARLLAERDESELIAFPAPLANRRDESSVTTALAGEEKLFESRKSARTGQRAQLRERIAQLNEEIRGLSAQQAAKGSETDLISKELVGVAELYKKNLVSISRYTQLQRDETRLQGERGQLIADISRARVKISETELQIIQVDQDFRTEVLKDLRDAQGKIAELKERLTAAEDQLKRVELRAPQSGFVHELSVHTVGGVVGNGETILQIVPRADELVVEAKVAPHDIDQVAPGANVIVRIMAGNQRTTPDITGVLTRVSADLTREQQSASQPAQAYYTVRIGLPADQVARLKDIRLVPGMPAEAFIQTYERTPLQYLLKPLGEQIARAFRER